MKRILQAWLYSKAGLKAAFKDEPAFRQVVLLALLGFIGACFAAHSFTQFVLLILPGVLCMIVELLNSAIENAVDFTGTHKHPLAKKAKDMGSAAQFVALVFFILVWGGYFVF
ncbi:Diacylglycerol kinase DgkA [Helicobacter sp. NHP19-012]|uniref:Diacylglycerol kinase n=1 Tax=Helicobacter gastrofelis TaxID=2849642 RepID=A0ABN6I8F7_9HELI|nr:MULTISPECIES: diacylglycerol kinase [unclassified Helicobacter]BCZ19862.1 Diacylglycerol kinase DgkA [Helicobacter sp. NHP19-012]GMB95533.1 Diacylglycerol kinase DgkA [Helicobacter sp. NHP22-001]